VGVILLWVGVFPRESLNPVGAAQIKSKFVQLTGAPAHRMPSHVSSPRSRRFDVCKSHNVHQSSSTSLRHGRGRCARPAEDGIRTQPTPHPRGSAPVLGPGRIAHGCVGGFAAAQGAVGGRRARRAAARPTPVQSSQAWHRASSHLRQGSTRATVTRRSSAGLTGRGGRSRRSWRS
jgi:hypothetical protein